MGKLKFIEKKYKFTLEQNIPIETYPIDIKQLTKYQTKFVSAQITSFDTNRFLVCNFLIEWLIKLEYLVSEGLFNDGFFVIYQILKISRLINDFTHICQLYQIFSNLLLKVDQSEIGRVLNYMADIAQETNQLSFLIDAYQRIGYQLSEAQDYDRAIRVYKKMLKVCWIHSDTLSEIKVYEMLAIQYFYKQDIKKCQMYLDRSLRGKLEG